MSAWASWRAAQEVGDPGDEPSDGCTCPLHEPDDYDTEDVPPSCACYYRCPRHCKGPDPVCLICQQAAVEWWGDLCPRCLENAEAAAQVYGTYWEQS